jgi:hypothetical protein
MAIVRGQWRARQLLGRNVGSDVFPIGGPNLITVDGHCIGIVARTWTGQPAGYGYALDGANAVIRAGKMRHLSQGATPPKGTVLWFTTGGYPGHVVTVDINGDCYSNVGSTLQRVPIAAFSGFSVIGWCYPQDVPGWS